MTTITGSLSLALGLSAVTGSIKISWPTFTDASGTLHTANSSRVAIASNGSYSFTLAPNVGASPLGTYYTATYYSTLGVLLGTEQWIVPDTTSVLTIQQIRVTQSIPPPPFQVQASQLYSADANVGDCLVFDGQYYRPATLQSIHHFDFSAQQTVTISQSQHGQGFALIVQVYDHTGAEIDGSIRCDPFSGDVTISFGSPESGYGFIYGGLARSLPNYAKTYINQSSCTIHQKQHRFNSPYLIVTVYDGDGYLIDSGASVQVSPTFDVLVSMDAPITFTVIVSGCLGVTSSGSGGSSSNSSLPQAFVAAVSSSAAITASTHGKGVNPLAFGFLLDGTAVQVGYQRNGSGDVTFDSGFRGEAQISSGAYQSTSAPYVVAAPAGASSFSITALMHQQGAYALAFCFDASGYLLEADYTRDSLGNLVVSLSPLIATTIQVIPGGWRGVSLYTQPVQAVLSCSIPSSQHGQGIGALAAAFTSDAISTAVAFDWSRNASGDLQMTFGSPFSGLIQVYQPQ